ncbi:MAG TPA: allantoate amidohydrolase [Thermomicrobiales bacterium]|jgi:allantoate deiminase|nr:allantoate amidohydrolase [Thermomicrobiales bacterium]
MGVEYTGTEMAREVLARCDVLGGISEEAGCLTRRFATPALRAAQEQVAGWMRAAGLSVRWDNVGNLRGRYEGDRSDAPALLLGSHLDTVRDAGKYDGVLGVLVALAAVERLHARGERLPYAVEIAAFADEEGLRYGTAYLGSRALAGAFDPALLDLADTDGVTMGDAIRAAGGDPSALAADRRDPASLLGYCEVHIEQGPALEHHDLPVGVVTAITGISHVTLTFTGVAGHAGTVAMDLRRDALCAAAECMVAIETLACATPGLVATVGQIAVHPGASNVIPATATISLDIRHAGDTTRAAAVATLRQTIAAIAARRQVALAWEATLDSPAVTCDTRLADLLADAVTATTGHPAHHLPSGAGHDAAILATITPAAMLFVRCQGGISHNPAEAVAAADVAVALDVLDRFLHALP